MDTPDVMLNAPDQDLLQTLANAGVDVKDAAPTYLEEPRGLYTGASGYVAYPRSVEEVSEVVKACNAASVGVLPYGGGTGLVSGQIAPSDPAPLIVSLERMSAIRDILSEDYTITAEAGATIAEVQDAAADADRLFPLSYASQGTARIGGALSVNSGGLNVLRYGMARDLCLGIEAVLPDGQILQGLKRLRKDNTGYDLRHLLIGAEGTLGIITAAVLELSPRPAEVATAFLAVPSPEAALKLLSLCKNEVGEAVSAFEIIPAQSFEFLSETFPDLRQPFDTAPDWCVLTEFGMGPHSTPEDRLAQVFEAAADLGLVTDGRISQNEAQRAEFWTLRETIPEANRRIGAIASHDISVPVGDIPDLIIEASQAMQAISAFRINAFGHLGDGNLHFNLFPPKGETCEAHRHHAPEITRTLHDLVSARGGSFSAEHGVGRAKVGELQRYGDPVKLSTMRTIKSALDPKGIMNPGAVLG